MSHDCNSISIARHSAATSGSITSLVFGLLLTTAALVAEIHADELAKNFIIPPRATGPWVYWYWCDGNITSNGITADVEAMQRVGIGGAIILDAKVGNPLGPVRFMRPEWRGMIRHALTEARRVGLKVNINNDAGWSGSGGPWITPELSSQTVVWSQKAVQGPAALNELLPQPPTKEGYYRDIAVLAFPTPRGDEEGKGYRIEAFRGIKTFGGATDVAGVCPWPKSVATSANWPELPAEQGITRTNIVNLSARLQPDGRVNWQVPAGSWTLLRVGHTPMGIRNRPSPAEGEGLECDKLSRTAIERHFAGMMAKLIAENGPLAGKTLVATHVDSWEAGSQNWTVNFAEEFKRRRGYDLLPFLPVLTGRMVDSLEVSERFLWDFRETIAELMLRNYAGHLGELARKHGLRLSIEAYDGLCDELRYAGQADEPQTEFWIPGFGSMAGWNPQVTVAMASAAHTYGKRILAAEAFTSSSEERWLFHPALLKPVGDWAFCAGVNRLVFHRYAMQPWNNRWPGMCFGPHGQHYDRTQTWWEQSRAWHQYLSRCQSLLREGCFVADICFLQPEGAPHLFVPPIPVPDRDGIWPDRPGYNYDGCSAEVLFKRMTVKNGLLTLPEGAQYHLLVLPTYNADDRPVFQRNADSNGFGPRPLPKFETMTPELLRRIRELVRAGATVFGTRPLKSPSLMDFPGCDAEVEQLADEIWGKGAGASGAGEHALGKGKVIWGGTPEKVLADLKLPPDFEADAALKGKVRFSHRHLTGGTDIYFVANKQAEAVTGAGAFRVCGKQPELWWPETGRTENAAVFEEKDGVTSVPLRLEATESVFVVFRKKSGNQKPQTGMKNWLELAPVAEVSGTWEVSFDPKWGGPAQPVTFDKLEDWSKRPEEGIRYYSGTAIYRKTLDIAPELGGKNRRLFLDLGQVAVMAEVKLNGKDLGILWKPPFRVEITEAVKPGANILEVKAVNLWVNRMIGDEQLPEDSDRTAYGTLKSWPAWVNEDKPSPTGRFTFASHRLWKKTDALVESGLLGPVTIQSAKHKTS